MDEIKNIFVNFENGDSILIHTNKIDCETTTKWAEKATKNKVLEAYEIRDDEIQYYCFDGRVWVVTEEQKQRIMDLINKKDDKQ
jgi:hypothetical protein